MSPGDGSGRLERSSVPPKKAKAAMTGPYFSPSWCRNKQATTRLFLCKKYSEHQSLYPLLSPRSFFLEFSAADHANGVLNIGEPIF